jgi:hypothetical protein
VLGTALNRRIDRMLPMNTTEDGQMFFRDMFDRVCALLPEGWELRLCMESGFVWVTLHNPMGDSVWLSDAHADEKSIERQVNDAICAARGL